MNTSRTSISMIPSIPSRLYDLARCSKEETTLTPNATPRRVAVGRRTRQRPAADPALRWWGNLDPGPRKRSRCFTFLSVKARECQRVCRARSHTVPPSAVMRSLARVIRPARCSHKHRVPDRRIPHSHMMIRPLERKAGSCGQPVTTAAGSLGHPVTNPPFTARPVCGSVHKACPSMVLRAGAPLFGTAFAGRE